MTTAKYKEITFTDADVVNPDDFIPGNSGYNPHRVRPWLIHDSGFTIAIVFASCEQDALDIAVDARKLDAFLIDLTDKIIRSDYLTTKVTPGYDPDVPEFVDSEGVKYWWRHEPAFLGNASEPFDIETLDMIELPNPPFSFAALFTAEAEGSK